jgi:hypothetical protein
MRVCCTNRMRRPVDSMAAGVATGVLAILAHRESRFVVRREHHESARARGVASSQAGRIGWPCEAFGGGLARGPNASGRLDLAWQLRP